MGHHNSMLATLTDLMLLDNRLGVGVREHEEGFVFFFKVILSELCYNS